jgi:hypothetical protein
LSHHISSHSEGNRVQNTRESYTETVIIEEFSGALPIGQTEFQSRTIPEKTAYSLSESVRIRRVVRSLERDEHIVWQHVSRLTDARRENVPATCHVKRKFSRRPNLPDHIVRLFRETDVEGREIGGQLVILDVTEKMNAVGKTEVPGPLFHAIDSVPTADHHGLDGFITQAIEYVQHFPSVARLQPVVPVRRPQCTQDEVSVQAKLFSNRVAVRTDGKLTEVDAVRNYRYISDGPLS